MKVTFWSALALVGALAQDLSEASADNKITVTEALDIVKDICEKLGIEFDEVGFDLAKQKFVTNEKDSKGGKDKDD